MQSTVLPPWRVEVTAYELERDGAPATMFCYEHCLYRDSYRYAIWPVACVLGLIARYLPRVRAWFYLHGWLRAVNAGECIQWDFCFPWSAAALCPAERERLRFHRRCYRNPHLTDYGRQVILAAYAEQQRRLSDAR